MAVAGARALHHAPRYLWGECIKTFIFALLTLPLLGMGLLMLPIAFRYLASSYAYAPRRSGKEFDTGLASGALDGMHVKPTTGCALAA